MPDLLSECISIELQFVFTAHVITAFMNNSSAWIIELNGCNGAINKNIPTLFLKTQNANKKSKFLNHLYKFAIKRKNYPMKLLYTEDRKSKICDIRDLGSMSIK